MDSTGIEALMASRLIALSKVLGVCPIGVDEVCRRLIGKAAMTVIQQDFIEFTGHQQLCGGQKSSCEAIVHCVKELYDW